MFSHFIMWLFFSLFLNPVASISKISPNVLIDGPHLLLELFWTARCVAPNLTSLLREPVSCETQTSVQPDLGCFFFLNIHLMSQLSVSHSHSWPSHHTGCQDLYSTLFLLHLVEERWQVSVNVCVLVCWVLIAHDFITICLVSRQSGRPPPATSVPHLVVAMTTDLCVCVLSFI